MFPHKRFRRLSLPLAALAVALGFGAVHLRAQASGPAASRETVRENSKDGLKYVWIPAGTFMMGCSPGDSQCHADEKPPHRVTLTRGFWMGQTEVTARAYQRFAGATGRTMPVSPGTNKDWTDKNQPISNVKWTDAQAYCGWVDGRLPTEAEWEYAARGGSTAARYGNLEEVAWYYNDSMNQPHDVAQKRPNSFGLYDMLGNVYNWASDWYDAHYYAHSPAHDPQGPAGGQARVLRGGGWQDTPDWVRASLRFKISPNLTSISFGFRCVQETGAR